MSMNYLEIRTTMRDLQEIDSKFKLGLTMFTEGTHGFRGNLRLLLNVYLVQENQLRFHELIQRRGLRWEFCVRSEAFLILIDSKRTRRLVCAIF